MTPALQEEMPVPESGSELASLLQQPGPRRIPHMGHAILFALLSYVVIQVTGYALILAHAPHGAEQFRALAHQPTFRVESQALAYVLIIVISWLVFPLIWYQSFA